MNLKRDIKPITYLKSRTAQVVREVNEERRTMVITQNGEAKMVIMGVEEYDQLQNSIAILKLVARAENEIRSGKTIPQEDVFRRMDAVIAEAKRKRPRTDE
ncbi:MAG: type II toxin-antitoxin system Phd/YefM family antitoxin [Acidobacteria bacterium]|nr:type II toxin-antitoxin system Phd/YefM family antitoxin [Acidobacteriota bacterium]